MIFSYVSLDPVSVTKPGAHTADGKRTFEGIPGIEQIPSGRLFATWYSGGTGEGCENYVLLKFSDDDGKTWSHTIAVADPPDPRVRTFDPVIWYAPNGNLYWFWAQSCGGPSKSEDIFDGIAGVWYAILENPDDDPDNFRFSEPRRIANGIMMNKPTVLKDGTWCMPCSIWRGNYLAHDSLGIVPGAYMIVSTDNGKSFSVRGSVDTTDPDGKNSFDEHIFIERQNGNICTYFRTESGISESISADGGSTWSKPVPSRTLTAPSSRFFIRRLRSGRLLAVINASTTVRKNLTAYLSEDDGNTWIGGLLLDSRENVSYPDGTEGSDGIYLVYDMERYTGGYILMAKITEKDILAGKLTSANSFLAREIDHSLPCPQA